MGTIVRRSNDRANDEVIPICPPSLSLSLWATTFDASATAPGTFTRSDGTAVSPSFMHQTMELSYVDDG